MPNIYLKVPSIDELHYRQEWMKDSKTMSYNAGYDMDLKGYDKITGTITKTDEEMITWYNNWINKEPDKYFAYIYDTEIKKPIGETYFYKNNNEYMVGILIIDKYRGLGYSKKALTELMKIAFIKYGIRELTDVISSDRENAIKLFESCGFTITKNIQETIFDKKKNCKKVIITKEEYLRR